MVETLNAIAAVFAAAVLNSAAICIIGVAVAVAVARLKGWSAASRYALWWLMIAFLIAAPFVSAVLPGETAQPSMVRAPVRHPALVRVIDYTPEVLPMATSEVKLSPVAMLLLFLCAASGLQMIVLARGFVYGLGLKSASQDAGEELQGLFVRLKGTRNVSLRVSGQIAIPAVIGYFRPMVLIPVDLKSRLSGAELEQVLLHELAHVSRYDDWSIALQRLLEAIAVWHPLLRYMGYRLSRDREMICDDLVASTHPPKGYAACLAKVAELGPFAPMSAMAVPLLERKSELLARVEMLLDSSRTHVPRVSGYRMLIALAGFVVLGLVGTRVPRLMAMPVSPMQAESTLSHLGQVPPVPPVPPVAPVPPSEPSAPASAHLSPVTPPIPPLPPNGSGFMYSYSTTDSDQNEPASGIYSIIVTTEDGQSSMFGRRSNYSYGDGRREPGTIEFKADHKTFVIRDKEMLAQAKKLLAPMAELGRKQSELGEQQEKLGELQSKLGEEQEKAANRPLDASQAENLQKSLQKLKAEMEMINAKSSEKSLLDLQEQLARLQAELADMQGEMGSAQGKLGEAQEHLAAKQGELGDEQGKLGKLQGELGRQQAEEVRRAEKKLNELIRDAQKRGLAEQVR